MVKRILPVLTAAALLLLFVACGDDDDKATSATADTSTAGASQTNAATPTVTLGAETSVASKNFNVPVSLIAAPGYVPAPRQDAGLYYAVERTSATSTVPPGYLLFILPTLVFTSLDGLETSESPDDLLTWIQSPEVIGYIELIDGPTDVTVDGHDAQQFDVRNIGADDRWFFDATDGRAPPIHFILAPGEPARLIIVEVGAKKMVIIGGPNDETGYSDEAFAALMPELDAMIASISFETG